MHTGMPNQANPYSNTGIQYASLLPGANNPYQSGHPLNPGTAANGSALPLSAQGTGLFPQFASIDPSKPHLGPQPSVAMSFGLAQTQAPPVLGPGALPLVPNAMDFRSGAILGNAGPGPQPSANPMPTNFATPGGRYVAAVQAVEATVVADWAPPNAYDTTKIKISSGQQLTVISRDDDGWWYGRTREGKEGYFPAAFVTVLASTAQGQFSAASGAAPSASTPGLAALPPVTVVIQPPPQQTPPPILMPPMPSMAAMTSNMNPMNAQFNPDYNLQGTYMSQSGFAGNSGPMINHMAGPGAPPPGFGSQQMMGGPMGGFQSMGMNGMPMNSQMGMGGMPMNSQMGMGMNGGMGGGMPFNSYGGNPPPGHY